MPVRKKTQASFHYSPSEHHEWLVSQTVQQLAYDGGPVRPWQAKLRRKVRQILGEVPAERCALNVRSLWTRDHALGRIEKIVFTAEPLAEVNAYVCLPATAAPPYTFFICVQGHSTGMHNSIAVDREDNSKPISVAGDHDFALGCMRRGIAALCIEQRSFGERRERVREKDSEYYCHKATMHALMLGRTLVGERVYDVDRGIDYLASRGDVDMKRLGVMGNSGGGTVSLFAAATLPRIAYAMPGGYFCTFADSIMKIHHCVDNYLPGLLQYAEMADVMGLFAPKPVVLVAGKQDTIFPIAATRKAFRQLKRIYAAAGAEDRCHLVEGDGGHRFYAEIAWKAMLKELAR